VTLRALLLPLLAAGLILPAMWLGPSAAQAEDSEAKSGTSVDYGRSQTSKKRARRSGRYGPRVLKNRAQALKEDLDGDGIPDKFDRCPGQREDFDGFEDEDGCPEMDNDKDLIPDAYDQCVNEKEDIDGFQDDDGCPDPDNDQDGIPDSLDACPNAAEDFDGFEDLGGCPDPDNDQDGIPDVTDFCPMDPETFNGRDDEDGCPD
jgi:hypothetical protein